jgi:polyisoprenoid-binding protein YceI
MILLFTRRLFGTAILVVWSIAAVASPTAWKIMPDGSSIKFTATQNGSPVMGNFKKFSGMINFDPDQLDKSNVDITIDIASISTSYKEIADTLQTPDWFDAKLFPQAVFKADHFTLQADKTYQANGTLTIRDKTIPVVLTFTLPEYSKTKALAKGDTTLQRTMFGLGKGDWAKTDDVKDEVKVEFVLSAVAS